MTEQQTPVRPDGVDIEVHESGTVVLYFHNIDAPPIALQPQGGYSLATSLAGTVGSHFNVS